MHESVYDTKEKEFVKIYYQHVPRGWIIDDNDISTLYKIKRVVETEKGLIVEQVGEMPQLFPGKNLDGLTYDQAMSYAYKILEDI